MPVSGVLHCEVHSLLHPSAYPEVGLPSLAAGFLSPGSHSRSQTESKSEKCINQYTSYSDEVL